MPPPKSLLSLFRLSLLHSNVPKIVLPTVLFLLAIMQALTQPPHTQYIKEGKGRERKGIFFKKNQKGKSFWKNIKQNGGLCHCGSQTAVGTFLSHTRSAFAWFDVWYRLYHRIVDLNTSQEHLFPSPPPPPFWALYIFKSLPTQTTPERNPNP